MKQKTEHKYAHILRAIADGDQVQWKDMNGSWLNLSHDDALIKIAEDRSMPVYFRIKPRTININGFEVPEPLRVAPDGNIRYWTMSIHEKHAVSFTWSSSKIDRDWLMAGLCHATREAAEAHARALLSFTKLPE